jgi:hypothetical protein
MTVRRKYHRLGSKYVGPRVELWGHCMDTLPPVEYSKGGLRSTKRCLVETVSLIQYMYTCHGPYILSPGLVRELPLVCSLHV